MTQYVVIPSACLQCFNQNFCLYLCYLLPALPFHWVLASVDERRAAESGRLAGPAFP